MTRHANLAFKRALDSALTDGSHPHFYLADVMVTRLARELRGGGPALLEALDQACELASAEEAETMSSPLLHQHLMSVWVTAQDQRDLVALTGRDREGWLDARWWTAPPSRPRSAPGTYTD